MTIRNVRRYASSHREFDDIEEFLKAEIVSGLNSIKYSGYYLDVLLDMEENSDTIIFSFNPAVTNPGVTRPYFVGAGIFSSLKASKVYFSDPSLDVSDELQLAWFAGNRKQPNMQSDFDLLIRGIAISAGVKNVIFVGTSGGGFAALNFSSRFPGSLAYVVNPQTDLLRYHPQHVGRYVKYGWGMTYTNAIGTLPSKIRTSVLESYEGRSENTVLWLQSATDKHHIDNHMLPLIGRVSSDADIHFLLGKDWGPGHHPAPKEIQVELLESTVQSDGKWSDIWNRHPDFLGPNEVLLSLH